MAQPPATRPASSAPPCFPSWSGGPTRRLAPTLEALAAQPPGLRPGTASQPPPQPPRPNAARARASTGGHRGGRRSGLPGLRKQAGAHTTYRSRGSLRRQPGSPQTPPKSPPRRHRGRRRPLSVSLSRGTEEELAGPPVPFPPPAHHPVTLWGGGKAPVPAEAAAPFPRNHVGGRRQRPPPPPQRWGARQAASLVGKAVCRPCPLPHPPPEGREGWASHRPSAKRRGAGGCGFRLRSPEASLVNSPWAAPAL